MRTSVALVTGASSGIGQALVRALMAQQWVVIGLARRTEALLALAKELGSDFIPVTCDVANRAAVAKTCSALLAQGWCPSLFFLNAGIAGEAAVDDSSVSVCLDHHERMMAVNYFGPLAFVQAFEKACLLNGGAHFIVTGSVNAMFAPPLASSYAASKAAVTKAFHGLSVTHVGTSLRFSCVYGGPVATEGLRGSLPFTMSASRMAHYMVAFARRGRHRGHPSLLYSTICLVLNCLPHRWVARLLGARKPITAPPSPPHVP